ncbi:MAG: hypothetical protein RJA22_245 [Verrucomicrobiota bacterium]|jgi:predicted peptidase
MRRRLLLLALAPALLLPGALADAASPAAPDMQQSLQFKATASRKLSSQYLLFLPQGYSPAKRETKQWPLILFLHGAGERGSQLQKVAAHGPPKIVKSRPDFPFIVVSPQCPADEVWDNDTLIALLDHVVGQHKVDPRRVYLTGLSMGGYGSWSLALRHPERFAAVAPICGGGNTIDILLASRRNAAALRSLPFRAFHGAKDTVVPLAESERMVNALKRAGVKQIDLTVYPEAGHDSWTEPYGGQELYDWFLQHARK